MVTATPYDAGWLTKMRSENVKPMSMDVNLYVADPADIKRLETEMQSLQDGLKNAEAANTYSNL